jgi:hypothetical protein
LVALSREPTPCSPTVSFNFLCSKAAPHFDSGAAFVLLGLLIG